MVKKKKIAFGRLDLMRNDELKGRPKIKIGFVGGGPNSFIGYSHSCLLYTSPSPRDRG